MAVRIHTKDGTIELPSGKRVFPGAWKATATARSDDGASAKKLKEALDRAEKTLKGMRSKSRSFR